MSPSAATSHKPGGDFIRDLLGKGDTRPATVGSVTRYLQPARAGCWSLFRVLRAEHGGHRPFGTPEPSPHRWGQAIPPAPSPALSTDQLSPGTVCDEHAPRRAEARARAAEAARRYRRRPSTAAMVRICSTRPAYCSG